MNKQIEIANTIKSQISRTELWAIGAKNFMALPETKEQDGGLQFSASLLGSKNIAVRIVLAWNDTYTVSFLAPRSGKVLSTLEGVYCDNLESVVIDTVEKRFAC